MRSKEERPCCPLLLKFLSSKHQAPCSRQGQLSGIRLHLFTFLVFTPCTSSFAARRAPHIYQERSPTLSRNTGFFVKEGLCAFEFKIRVLLFAESHCVVFLAGEIV